MTAAYIALGSNLGDRLDLLRRAVARLAGLGTIAALSSVYETAPVGYTDQPAFLNAVIMLETERSPVALLRSLLAIEAGLGRVRSFPNAPRTLDLDLLLVGDQIVSSPELALPHPRLHERAFVLVPLAEIAPAVIHPVSGKSIAALLEELGDTSGVRRLENASLHPGLPTGAPAGLGPRPRSSP
jgi:2-amino-4-hydroxy-6-hydroxymethyldihydropteridine diphosphokinase